MKIAVPFEDSQVFQHFGRSAQFKFYEAENGQLLRTEVIPTNGQGHGALAGFLVQHGADVVLCGGIGTGAQVALMQAGIQLFGGLSGAADAAVADYLAGKLVFDPDIHCTHHDHDEGHSCGSHCGGGCHCYSRYAISICYNVSVAYGTDREASAGKGVGRIVCESWQGASGWRTLFLFCLIFPCSAVLFSLPTDCKCRRSPRTPRTQTTLFRSKISNALMTQSSLLARREFFRTSPHYKSAPIRSFCDFEQRASPKNHQKVELHKTSLQSCRVLL